MPYACGIDLGTTYSCVAVYKNGAVDIIANDQGCRTTPSWMAFTDTERLVGEAAKNQASMNPNNTVFDVKRLIGRKFSDREVQDDKKQVPYSIISDNKDQPLVQVEYKGEVKTFTPPELSAMVLTRMKEAAEAYLGEPVTEAVITVPAYFNDSQRQSTKDAASIAGLKVLRLINEPTAACLAYGLEQKGKEKNVLVFDLGGGTFDCSILSVDNGMFEVKSTGGNNRLGGVDLDLSLLNFFRNDFKRKHKKDLSNNARAVRRLLTACERAKRTLSSSTQATLEIDSLYEGIDYTGTITRARFEDLCGDYFRQTIDTVEKVLREAKMDKGSIDDIVLVGGSTRIPKVKKLLSDFFHGKTLCESVNPDEAVAYGAALQAAILSGNADKKLDEVLLVDVNSLSLGIETAGGVMTKLVPKGTTLPCKKNQIFSTYVDNQTRVNILVFEGERVKTSDNHRLGEFVLDGIPLAPRGVPQIEVEFDVDTSGLLTVSATDKGTGKSQKITIKNDTGRLTQEEIERMVAEAEQFKEEDAQLQKVIEAKQQLEAFVYQAKTQMEEKKDSIGVGAEEALKTLSSTLDWLDENPHVSLEELTAKKQEIEKLVYPLLASVKPEEQSAPNEPVPSRGPDLEDLD